MADLAGVRAKLRRADELRNTYDELFESYLETHPYSILFEFDPETGWHVFRWVVLAEPPLEELSLIFSDILGNLRSSLDYLVWQLVLKGGRKPGRQAGFPIVKRERDWPVQGASALKGVGPEWAALIEAMQPFQRPERPELHPLSILEHVNNLTKHRFLPAAVLTVENFGYLINIADVPEGERFESQDHLDRPVENGGEVARFRTESHLPVAVHIADNPRFRVSFNDGVDLDWAPIDLVAWVGEAIAQFEPAFY